MNARHNRRSGSSLAPASIHVLLGTGCLRPEEFGAYYHHVFWRLEAFDTDRPATEPYP